VKLIPLLEQPISQAEFAEMVGLSEARVSQLMSEGVMVRGDTAHDWLIAYCDRLRDMAAGRASSEIGGLDLVQERAALAREQRIAQALKNAVARGEFAPVGLLADILASASSSVVDRLDQLEGILQKACPDLPEEAKSAINQVLASARNEWIRVTAKLIVEKVEALIADDSEADDAFEEAAL